jgi:hypothetical protein
MPFWHLGAGRRLGQDPWEAQQTQIIYEFGFFLAF